MVEFRIQESETLVRGLDRLVEWQFSKCGSLTSRSPQEVSEMQVFGLSSRQTELETTGGALGPLL